MRLASGRAWLARHSTEVALAALVFCVHGYFYNGTGWNQNTRLDVVYAFVDPGTPDTHSFRINRFVSSDDAIDSYNSRDWARVGGNYYSNKAPGSSLWPIPLYALLRGIESFAGIDPLRLDVDVINAYLLTVWTSTLWTALASVALLRLVRRQPESTERDAVTIALIYAFSTLAFPFDTEFWGHPMAGALIALSIESFDRVEDRPVAAGFFYGAAILTDYFAMAAAGAFAVLALRGLRWRRVAWAALGATVPLGVLLVYQRACFGSFFATAARSMGNPYLGGDSAKIAGKFGEFSGDTLRELLVSWNHGIFVGMPVLLFAPRQILRALDALVDAIRGRQDARHAVLGVACATGAIGSLFALACYSGWHGGIPTGARYLIPSLPFWCILLARPSKLKRTERAAFAVLALISTSNMFVIAASWSQNSAFFDRLWTTLYDRFRHGMFALQTGYTHGLHPDPSHPVASAFNLGQKVGLHGLASIVPVSAALVGGSAWLLVRAARPRRATSA